MSKLKSVSVLRQEDKEFFKNFPLIFWLIFIVFGVLLLVPIMIYLGFSAKAFSGLGSGTQTNPYQISNCQQLQEIQDNTTNYYILVTDIDCSDTINWNNGAGFYPRNFKGYLDGRNHSITGLYINRTLDYATGLFGFMDAGEVKNIRFLNSANTQGQIAITGGRNVGLVAGELRGTATIRNVSSELSIATSGSENGDNSGSFGGAGGIVGLNRGSIFESSSSGTITFNESQASTPLSITLGGISSYMDIFEGDIGYVYDSYFTGTITTNGIDPNNISGVNCGGIVGQISELPELKRSYSAGTINCDGQARNSGGIAGYAIADGLPQSSNTIQNNFSLTEILSPGANKGGIIGSISQEKSIDTNYFDVTRTGYGECTDNYGTCVKINTNENPEPDYFKNSSQPLFSSWNQSEVWLFNETDLPTLRNKFISPDPPTNLQAVRNNTSFTLSWDAPIPLNGRSEGITDYVVEYKIVSETVWNIFDDGQTEITGAVLDNLDMTRGYNFRVKAINDQGSGLYSSQATSNVAAPQKIIGVTGTAKAKSFEITWDQNSAALTYKVQYRKTGDSNWISTGLDLDIQNRKFYEAGLKSQTTYEVRIAGVNDGGQGEWSDVYLITTLAQNSYSITNCQQLQNMKNDLSGSYTLANNIDCSETETWNNGNGFEPVGNGKSTPFTGDFNGNNKTISGILISQNVEYNTNDYYGSGMFGFAYAATVKNVRFNNASINATYYLSPQDDQDGDGVPDNLSDSVNDIASDVPTSIGEATGSAVSIGQKAPLAGAALSDGLPEVYAGTVAGLVFGGGTFTNINVSNSAVLGASSGLVIGGVYTFKSLFTLNDISDPVLSPFSPQNQVQQTVISNVTTSGAVNGIIGGGVVGAVATEGSTVSDVRVLIQNANSTASVDANIAGGIVGASGSASLLLPIFTAINGETGDLGESINSAVNALPVVISNSTSRGTISTCSAASGVQIGALGGIVGAALNTRIQNSSSSSKVEACSNIFGQALNFGDGEVGAVYGGSLGGLAGVMILSQIDNSFATGKVGTKLNPNITYGQVGEELVQPGVNASVTGGLVGTIVSVVDQNDLPVINNSYSTGNVINDGGSGMAGLSGGLVGTMFGSGTIKSSYASGKVETIYNQYTQGGAVVVGGLIGSGVGIDALSVAETFLSGSPSPAQGIILNQSYATGNAYVTKQNDEGFSPSISGGLVGILLGNAQVLNSKATGNVGNNISKVYKANVQSPIVNVDLSPSISGGLVGVTMGVNAQTFLGLISGNDVEPSDGVLISNSYAKGDSKALISGGLIGYADLKVRISKAYAAGNVDGTVAGGLIGGNGLVGSALTTTLAVLFGGDGQNNTQPLVAGIFEKLTDVIGPVKIDNTYATGNVSASPASGSLIDYETGDPLGVNPFKFPTVAGGLIGFYAANGGKVDSSYASGNITLSSTNLPNADMNLGTVPNIPDAAGGVFGFVAALPQPDVDAVYNEANLPFIDYLKTPFEAKSTFSASTITAPQEALTGPVAGFFLSPLSVGAQIVTQQPTTDPLKEKIYKVNDIYYDKYLQDTNLCSGPSNPKNFVRDIINSANVPDGLIPVDNSTGQTGQNIYDNLKDAVNDDENFDPIYETYMLPAFDSLNCVPVNANNSQPDYFKNNKVNAPLNKWNFNSVWVTRKNDYPKFTAGPEDPTPEPEQKPPIVTPVSKNTPGQNTPGQTGGAGTPVPALAELLNPENVKAKKDNWLMSLLKKIPEPIAKTIPYTLLLVLIAIALFYTYSALLEKHRRAQLQLIIRRIYASGKARATYLSIISHYLNTPLTKMRSTIELLHGTKKLNDNTNKAVMKELSNVAKSTDTLLTMGQNLTMNQQQEIKALESIKLPSILTKPAVWLPISILFTLTLLVNVLFVYADRYDVNGMVVLTQIVLGAVGGATIAVSYFQLTNSKKLRLIVSRQAEVEKSTAQQQGQFIDTVYSALSDEVDSLSTYTKEISSYPKSEGFKAGLSELQTVVDKMDKVATLSRSVPGVVWRTNVTQTFKNVMTSIRPIADKAGVSIQSNINSNALVNIDDKSLTQLIAAPLTNAVEYSKTGSKVAVTIEQIDKAVVLTIVDNGRGIAEKQLVQLFEPFSRFESTEQFDHQGMGLDLYLCQVITEHYGGSLVLVSKEGQGTTARIKVPVSPSA